MKLTEEQQFFYDHGAYNYNPKTETEKQGRVRCAKALAQAEQTAQNMGWTPRWDWDEDADWSWMAEADRNQEHEVYFCQLLDAEGNLLASLNGIFDPSREYKRVVEAELALEAEADLDREIETIDAH